jgi:hypothetical protein
MKKNVDGQQQPEAATKTGDKANTAHTKVKFEVFGEEMQYCKSSFFTGAGWPSRKTGFFVQPRGDFTSGEERDRTV